MGVLGGVAFSHERGTLVYGRDMRSIKRASSSINITRSPLGPYFAYVVEDKCNFRRIPQAMRPKTKSPGESEPLISSQGNCCGNYGPNSPGEITLRRFQCHGRDTGPLKNPQTLRSQALNLLFFFITLGLEMSDTKVYEP